ncbi:hypothetical protein M514_12612 [Trichuris suis]|uniref:Uncharacterized protein n=1 Tax=Trichuris suis TaxID=68888 RepID=A0A085MTN5_9BILA|nr:hypothetical protein M513_12612 [Trichuris suis]KFD60581.1 hypothetical protein M514_12612 [Trichuris suis]
MPKVSGNYAKRRISSPPVSTMAQLNVDLFCPSLSKTGPPPSLLLQHGRRSTSPIDIDADIGRVKVSDFQALTDTHEESILINQPLFLHPRGSASNVTSILRNDKLKKPDQHPHSCVYKVVCDFSHLVMSEKQAALLWRVNETLV